MDNYTIDAATLDALQRGGTAAVYEGAVLNIRKDVSRAGKRSRVRTRNGGNTVSNAADVNKTSRSIRDIRLPETYNNSNAPVVNGSNKRSRSIAATYATYSNDDETTVNNGHLRTVSNLATDSTCNDNSNNSNNNNSGNTTTTASTVDDQQPLLLRSSKGLYRQYINDACSSAAGVVPLYEDPEACKHIIEASLDTNHTFEKNIALTVSFTTFLLMSLEMQFNRDKYSMQQGAFQKLVSGLNVNNLRQFFAHADAAVVNTVLTNAVTMLLFSINLVISKIRMSAVAGSASNRPSNRIMVRLNAKDLQVEIVWSFLNPNINGGTLKGHVWSLMHSELRNSNYDYVKLEDMELIEIHSGTCTTMDALNQLYDLLKSYKVVIHDYASIHKLMLPCLQSRLILMEPTKLIVGKAERLDISDQFVTDLHYVFHLVSEYVHIQAIWKQSFKVRPF